jgi:D-alanyl-D-alanine dipeptidase
MKSVQSYILFTAAIALCLTSCRHQAAPEPAAPESLSLSEYSENSENSENHPTSSPYAGGLEGVSPADSEAGSIPSSFVLLADVCPDIIQEIRYYTTYNFVGERIPGYERPIAYLTRQAADSLKLVCDDLKEQGYRLKVFDAYRPQMAVDFFVRWGSDLEDQRMKDYFYPDCPKSELFRRGYIAHKSGHTRGSTLDLTLFDMKTEREVDMGGTYDFLGETSHYNYSRGLTRDQINHRRILREAMMRHGFKPIAVEWWHFTLRNEPYPDHYFTFPIR